MSFLPRIKIVFIIIFLFLLSSCSENEETLPEEIKITVTLPPYADFVSRIAGNRAKINTLIPAGANAHSFEPKPEAMKEILISDIYFRVGEIFNFEQIFLNKIGSNNINNIVDCSADVNIIDNDPHIWLSPSNVKIISDNILKALIDHSPHHRNYFVNNRDRFIEQLDSLGQLIENRLKNKKNRILLVYHPAWKYFTQHFNLKEIAIEKEGKSPKARDLKEFIYDVKQNGAECLFYDPHFDNSAVTTIATSLGLEISTLNPLPSNYLNNLVDIGNKLDKYLK